MSVTKIINRICVKVVIAQNDTDLSKIKPFIVTKCFTKAQHGKFQIIKHINYDFSKVSCYDFNISFLIILWSNVREHLTFYAFEVLQINFSGHVSVL